MSVLILVPIGMAISQYSKLTDACDSVCINAESECVLPNIWDDLAGFESGLM